MSVILDGSVAPEGFRLAYKAEFFGGYLSHTWSISNEAGGVHIWARTSKCPGYPDEWIGGVECHWPKPPSDYSGWFTEKPSQEHCWLLDGPCWHDGSSLYFSERIAPMLPPPGGPNPDDMAREHHAFIGQELLSWHRDKIAATTVPGAVA